MNDTASGGRGIEPSARAQAAAASQGGGQIKVEPLKQLMPYVMRYRGRVAAAFIALVVAALTTLAVPIAVRRMVDFGFSTEGIELIDSYFAVMIAVAAVLAGASAMRFYLVTTLGERIVADLRGQLFSHLTALSPTFFDRSQSGELLSRLTADTTQIKAAVGASVSIALRNLVLFVGASIMMVVTSPKLSLYVLGAIPLIVLPLVGFGRAVRRRSRMAQDTLADASAFAAEQIGAVRTLQAYTNERSTVARFAGAVERAYRAAQRSTLARAVLTAFAIFLVFASVVVVLWIGAQDVLGGRMSAGRLSQFVLYAVFAAGGLGELSQVWGEISAASGAAERLFEIMRAEPAIKMPARPVELPPQGRGEVAFDDVHFAYPTRPDSSALHGITFHVRPGEKIAIVGPSGAGKSTIFHLILRFYDPTSGTVSVDGVRADAADPQELRRRIALVPQDTAIFATSVRENIRFGRPGATDDEVARAAEAAAAAEFIHQLPLGYETPVGERGVMLSGGQRQRIAIARAILRAAPLLLLDEATSSLDAENETLVQKALTQLMQERTTLVIAHRLATVLRCDRILVLDQGRIVEEGTHESLVVRGGLYARLAKLQFEGG
jgi:ATP-binding cassette subfamily B protein